MPAPTSDVIVLLEYLLILSGLIPLWRCVLSPAARARAASGPPLPAWEVAPPDFLLCLFVIVAGGILSTFAAGLALNAFHLPPDTKTILNSAAFQIGLLLGAAFLPLKLGHPPLLPPLTRDTIVSGVVTFLIALPLVTAVNLVWVSVLKFTGWPTDTQELVRLVAQIDSPVLLALFITVATAVAPITEELLFRATLFRFLRTRVPRAVALLLPAAIFATFHFNLISFLPLLGLAVILSLAYERTGRIATAMIAHGLFNLHTVVLLLAGVTQ